LGARLGPPLSTARLGLNTGLTGSVSLAAVQYPKHLQLWLVRLAAV